MDKLSPAFQHPTSSYQENRQNSTTATADNNYFVTPPAVSLPKGGGAIKGMGEKFAANPVTGTGSMSVPIATSPGRSGFGPQISLSYDSGSGNGTFGFGWSLSLPSMTRKTDKGLPRYDDATESDVFILSGAEDLVPVLVQNAEGRWHSESLPDRTVNGKTYAIKRYRPRIEGLFARIERWTNIADATDVHWCSISKDNILTLYGQDANSRIVDPEDPRRIFSWLICETRDDKGNAILYTYKLEDGMGVDLGLAHERNRGDRTDPRRTANRYLKRIRHGNRISLLDANGHRPHFLAQSAIDSAGWMFEVVFDYGEHDAKAPTFGDLGDWDYRHDPFSSYRAGFEVRTTRLCQRVLMFHHIPDLPNGTKGYDGLVRSTDFTYAYEKNPQDVRNPVYSFLVSVTQSGYQRDGKGGYLQKSLPPLEFTYSQPDIDETVRQVDRASLENLPEGLDGSRYQWVDLDGEGLSGILTEQGNGWFYKRNLSPINEVQAGGKQQVEAKFAAVQRVASKPASGLGDGAQFLDLAGDGQPDLVTLRGAVPGFYERTSDQEWKNFVPLKSFPRLDWEDPNLKFIDLNGDGHSDILITEDHCFVWYPSLAEDGFGPAQRVYQPWDEEKGPRVVFADRTQSIHLADMSGDGLTDIVRIDHREVCYWPNLGYGRFGAKVTMDHPPRFDCREIFDPRRIVLADIDGSGTTDILYLCAEGVQVYFNQSGNSWSAKRVLRSFPKIDGVAAVTAIDLLGNGTACLVWSSALPGNARREMRYLDLMGSQKPHLLVKMVNNLGAETTVQYAPSTKFYLQDQLAGKPWITKLPFPVHVVEKVTVRNTWRKTSFSSTYSYHHGYFDGFEREFRGFGRVEQFDVESYGEFANGNSASPYITLDKTLYQPPIKTVTWHHTGALLENQRILAQFEHEYFPRWFEDLKPGVVNVLGTFQENDLPEPDLVAQDLDTEEWREALRACKGMMLRQEVYELDVDALEQGKHRPVKLFSTAYHNCHIQRLQGRGSNPHAVFLVTESEAITYHYELDLTSDHLTPDPRIAHTLNLKSDEYGNILQSVAVVYPRLGQFQDPTLPANSLNLIHQVQRETHLAYTETRYTQDVDTAESYRLRVPCEVLTYELTGISPEDASDRSSPDPRDNRYFDLDELRRFRLSPVYQSKGEVVQDIAYHQRPNRTTPQKRLVEHARTLFFKDDGLVLSDLLPLGQLGRLGLVYENYKLALTEDLLGSVFGAKLGTEERSKLSNAQVSGHLSGASLATRFPGMDTTGQYWVRSGIAGFEPDAAQHFYLPERYTDPFGNITTLKYDLRDLYVESSTDMLGNTTRITEFDFRVMAPREMQDINHNLSEVYFDALGLPTAMVVKGKGTEGDNLTGFNDALANPALNELTAFFNGATYDAAQARRWLGNATARHVYYFGETRDADGSITWGTHPACACGIVREQHLSQLASGEQSPLQASFEYSDGMGSVVVKKVQAEPEAAGQPLRWVANGKTILNNKGKPVKQYEPYFSSVGHRFEEPKEEGVTPVIYYDAVGRTVRTELPDGSYSRVEFSPWQIETYDPNDTVMEAGNVWVATKTAATATPAEKRAARLAAEHANTPALTILDSLGREVIAIAHNRVKDAAGALKDEKYLTFTKLDAEGKPLWIRDARGNLVMQYVFPFAGDHRQEPVQFVPTYDIAGNLLFQHSMDAGDRWMLNDAAGKPMLAWDNRGHRFHTAYDALHRPIASFVTGADLANRDRTIQLEKIIYGDTPDNGLANTPEQDQTRNLNLRGKPYQHYDTAGLVTHLGRNPATGKEEAFDFKGNLLRSTRQLIQDYQQTPDWSQTPTLEIEVFSSSTRYDALDRPMQITTPDNSVIMPIFNEANLLNQVKAKLRGAQTETLFVKNIDYNAKGQRILLEYSVGDPNVAANVVQTAYDYERETFRLKTLRTIRKTDNTLLQGLSYTYDPVGNITEISDDSQAIIFHNGERVEPMSQYVYDALYRLIQATGREHIGQTANNRPTDRPELKPHYDFNDSTRCNLIHPNDLQGMRRYTQQYEYDPVGNILAMLHRATGGDWTRRYDYATDSNRLRTTNIPSDGNDNQLDIKNIATRYRYDEHGNMIEMPHLKLMRWDFKDQLRASAQQVRNDGGTPEITYYVYDASGQRVRKVTELPNGTRKKNERIYLGGFEIYREYNGDGTTVKLERETLHVMDDQRRIALVETKMLDTENPVAALKSIIRYQLDNHLGSAGLELDQDGNVISYEEYHPYGTTAYQTGRSGAEVSLKRYRYTGKERDEETGLNYHGARYYALWLGRWVSCDPIGIADRLNIYDYVSNNPVRFFDPNGRKDKDSQKSTLNQALDFVKGAGEQYLTSGKEVLVSYYTTVIPGVNIFFGAKKGIDALSAIKDQYEKNTSGVQHQSGPAALVNAAWDTLSPLAASKNAADKAERAEEKGDYRTAGKERVKQLVGLVQFGVMVAGAAEGVKAATTPKPPTPLEPPAESTPAESTPSAESEPIGGASKKTARDVVEKIHDFEKKNAPIDLETATDMVRATGRFVAEDIEFKVGKTKPGNWAEYNPSTPEGENTVLWTDYLKEGKFQVTVNRGAMWSSEKAMRAIAHEIHEIEGLRAAFEASGGKMSRMEVKAKIDALHREALKADEAAWKSWLALPKTQ